MDGKIMGRMWLRATAALRSSFLCVVAQVVKHGIIVTAGLRPPLASSGLQAGILNRARSAISANGAVCQLRLAEPLLRRFVQHRVSLAEPGGDLLGERGLVESGL